MKKKNNTICYPLISISPSLRQAAFAWHRPGCSAPPDCAAPVAKPSPSRGSRPSQHRRGMEAMGHGSIKTKRNVENMGKIWENMGKNMGTYGKNVGTYGNIWEKMWENIFQNGGKITLINFAFVCPGVSRTWMVCFTYPNT